MKKAIVIYIIIIAGIYAAFTALDSRGSYAAERDIWKINDAFAKAARDPKSVPEARFGQIVSQYTQFIKRYPDSKLASVAHILIGRVYLTKGDHEKARIKYEEVVSLYKDQPNIAVEAVADIGRSYALENNNKGIIGNYQRVIRDYPLTQIGMQAPILLAKLYQKTGDQSRAQDAIKSAIAHYKKIIKENPDSRIEFDAMRSLGTAYLSAGEYRKAVETLGKVLIKYSEPEYMNKKRVTTMIRTINTISLVQLKDYNLPVNIYQEFIREHPDHPYSKSFQEMINSITMLKENKVTIETK